jgi:hypothetical protein
VYNFIGILGFIIFCQKIKIARQLPLEKIFQKMFDKAERFCYSKQSEHL